MKKINKDAIQDIIYRLEEIQEDLNNEINGTEFETHFNAYGQYGLNQLLGYGNRYDSSLLSLIEGGE